MIARKKIIGISNTTHISGHLTHPKYRADIDGFRALAILLVVGLHTFPNKDASAC